VCMYVVCVCVWVVSFGRLKSCGVFFLNRSGSIDFADFTRPASNGDHVKVLEAGPNYLATGQILWSFGTDHVYVMPHHPSEDGPFMVLRGIKCEVIVVSFFCIKLNALCSY